MNQILVIGINHKTAPIEIREKFYFNGTQQELLLSELRNNPSVAEAIVLSTCNRTEIYCHAISLSGIPDAVLKLMFAVKGLAFDERLRKHFYIYAGQEAVRHF